jgi:hypothetical protein
MRNAQYIPVRDPCPPAAGDVGGHRRTSCSRLCHDTAGLEKNPAAKMFDCFASLTAEGNATREVHGFPALSTIEVVRVGQRDIDSWPAY